MVKKSRVMIKSKRFALTLIVLGLFTMIGMTCIFVSPQHLTGCGVLIAAISVGAWKYLTSETDRPSGKD